MHILIFSGVAIGLLLCDMILKNYVETYMTENEERPVRKTGVLLRKVHNKGMCLNSFEKYPKIVKYSSTLVTFFVLVAYIFSMFRKKHYVQKMGVTMLTAGAFGNTIDRWTKGYVTDYIGFKSKHKKITAITYNLSDFFIMIGTLLIWFSSIFQLKKKR